MPAWIALHAFLGDILSLSLSLASLFQTVPGSSSSWSKPVKVCNHADFVLWIKFFLSSLPLSPAFEESFSNICWETSFASILGAKIGCPNTPVVGFAGDGAFGISMNEMSSCAREEWPAITMVIFRNYQWGAETVSYTHLTLPTKA